MRLARLAALSLAGLLVACGAASPEVKDDDATGSTSDDALTGSYAVGTQLKTTADVNLREGASTSYDIVRVLSKGTVVQLVASAPKNGFYEVDADGDTGWVSGKYLAKVASSGGSGGSSGGGSTSSQWVCNGTYSTTKPADGVLNATSFGCWTDSNGTKHGDAGDNCIPGCFSKAQAAGVCKSGETGKQCEERVSWYAADAGRYGCNARLRVTNPANGKSAVVVVLDYGPACWVESKISAPVLDLSGRVTKHLFGGDVGVTEKRKVTVEEVDPSTPVGAE